MTSMAGVSRNLLLAVNNHGKSTDREPIRTTKRRSFYQVVREKQLGPVPLGHIDDPLARGHGGLMVLREVQPDA